MNLIYIIGLVCLSAVVVTSQSDGEPRFKVCGKYLADALSTVCHGIYFGSKRNMPIVESQNDDYSIEHSSDDFTWPYISGKTAAAIIGGNSVGPHHRRFRRGVVDECCKKACSISDLRSYCGN